MEKDGRTIRGEKAVAKAQDHIHQAVVHIKAAAPLLENAARLTGDDQYWMMVNNLVQAVRHLSNLLPQDEGRP